ncbi:ribosome maturation factor RimP [Sutcliffiella cohnii]|uniref:Ribosome maturation factor RimP n=1 Tax=Sutcliffiella cohnii TaxID=33932 RepID=A0A223KRR6_9BACI|nr:ribosome maturation factor RimP [Sutcliffiella cohnii]AST92023.1 ribosome maturation factor RimP [Sutcliffiella cohnii]
MSEKVTETVQQLMEPIVLEMNLELVDIEYLKEGSSWFLRVYVDKDGGIDIEDCGVVSEKLSEKLDDLDPIPHNYFLEVSSPGAERPLKKKEDIARAIGKNINVKTYEPIEGTKTFEGTLISFDNETLVIQVTIKTKKKEVSIPYEKVAKARLAISFS